MKESLIDRINYVFPYIEMPAYRELSFCKPACEQDKGFFEGLELYRDKEITGEVIRLVHQELYLLSGKSWAWILPHYIRYCLTPEGEYNGSETEFLIYNLGPSKRFRSDTKKRLSKLNNSQISCLTDFCYWLLQDPKWRDVSEDDIQQAIDFLRSLSEE